MTVSARADLTIVRDALADTYDVIEVIGRGGMAAVYRARHRDLGRDVAIKVLPLTSLPDGDMVARFEREAHTMAKLEHRHIVPIFEVGRRDEVIYFVMKYLRGQSLATRLKQEGTLSAKDVKKILAETASALGYAAQRGIVHRDIKPDNILLDEHGRCVVTDFGIARSMSETKLTQTGISVGTPRYMSPEQARGKVVDVRSDLYSLGVLGYECLVGRTPFDGEDAIAIALAHIQEPLPRPRLAFGEERALFKVIERMLAKHPEDRYQSADELRIALESPLPAGVVTPVSVPPNGPQSWRREATIPAGVGTLPEQHTTIRAIVVTTSAFVRAYAPRVRRRLAQGTRVAIDFLTRAAVLSARLAVHLYTRARARSRRFWLTTALAAAAVVPLYYAVHFATMHRSRCPDLGAYAKRDFNVLADNIEPVRAGSNVDVYYDVCGLDANTSFTTRLVIVRHELRLRWLLRNGMPPRTFTYDEEASGRAERRHRTISLEGLPSGTYLVAVTVTNAEGQRHMKEVAFQVIDR